MNTVQKVLAMREGGNVRRAHCIPHHGEYTVGKHSFDAVSLLLELHPNPSRELILAVLHHDIPERWLGDLPATAKWQNPALAAEYGVAEKRVEQALGLCNPNDLSQEERDWLNAVDRIEFWLWCHDQDALGNRHIVNAKAAVEGWLHDYWESLPVECRKFIHEFGWSRTSEKLETEDERRPQAQSAAG